MQTGQDLGIDCEIHTAEITDEFQEEIADEKRIWEGNQ